ncbi:hypothetical protein ABLB84_19495, partial [Xenorhabdus szentirmaii]|uniref:hypothetical protein n=1 Tax=Xenorhabdus szentirmaii TaxID=290112 RepID=UPI0032B7165F
IKGHCLITSRDYMITLISKQMDIVSMQEMNYILLYHKLSLENGTLIIYARNFLILALDLALKIGIIYERIK